MTDTGFVFIFLLAGGLAAIAMSRGNATARAGFIRAAQQLVVLVPRMLLAMIAAGFMVMLIPTELIARYLGEDSGLVGILIGTVAGLFVPSGGVVAFALAAAFVTRGASVPAIVAFLTGWSVFAAHRVVIFEIPLLGGQFARMRLLSVMILPPIAGALALLVA